LTKQTIKFSPSSTDFHFESRLSQLKQIVDQKNAVIITDENVFTAHESKFRNWNTIVLKPGEQYKIQPTADSIIEQLIEIQADRTTTLIGVGGGVVTDITGYVASIYMRGIRFGFVPTTLLALVDASIGGKNGVDVGAYKNMAGIIRQLDFILHDYSLLASMPINEWQNGFAEIIKHACIKDAAMFRQLETGSVEFYQKRKTLLAKLIKRNALIKIKVVQNDELETGDRKLLNFGHTLGHALETQYELSHGQAISIGMIYAATLSNELLNFRGVDRLAAVLQQYGLPTYASFNARKVFNIMKMDKKKQRKDISYILLERIGKGKIQSIALSELESFFNSVNS